METIISNCTIVTPDILIKKGSVVIRDGRIAEIDDHPSTSPGYTDAEKDFLIPGLIEMHTDNLEKNIQPRPGVIWPSIMAAALAHDNQVAGSGITTVYDAMAVGGLRESSLRSQILEGSVNAICEGIRNRIFKADHFLHLRCEIGDPGMEEMLEKFGICPRTRLISVMDHTPGQRQWRDLAKWRLYHRGKQWTDEDARHILSELKEMQKLHGPKNRNCAVSFARERHIPLASHDDTTRKDAREAAAEGINIAEFPTTLEAAETAAELGMKTIMGAPNAVRGGSHSGNIPAEDLARRELLDGLSSDYVPNSLLHSAFHLSQTLDIPLTKTVAMVSSNIAEMVGLDDRGQIAEGKLADLVQVKIVGDLPVVRKVWKEGKQIS